MAEKLENDLVGAKLALLNLHEQKEQIEKSIDAHRAVINALEQLVKIEKESQHSAGYVAGDM